jgi:surface antigen
MKTLIFKIVLVTFLCFSSISTFAQTTGTLNFTFTCPKHTSGNYETNGRYALAVWIETSTGTFVKTKIINWGGSNSNTGDHLAGSSGWKIKSAMNVVDATSGATSTNFSTRSVTWNGTNVAGAVVADGAYRVAIQETWGHSTNTVIRYINFTKGTAIDTQTPAADTNFTAISLTWSPTLALENFSTKPELVVYPNPSNGIFNLEFKNEVTSIMVIDILGKTVLEEKNEASTVSKSIDLSSFQNGVYIIRVSNGTESSEYKVFLEK